MSSIFITNNTGSNIILEDLGNLVLIPGVNNLSGVLERERLVESAEFANELEVTGNLDLAIDDQNITRVIDIFSNFRESYTGLAGDVLSFTINAQTNYQQTDNVMQFATLVGGNGGLINLSAGGVAFSFLGTGDFKFSNTAGLAGQALVSNGAGATPTWQTLVNDQGSSQYIQFANTLIQWGIAVTNTGGTQTVTLPTTFASSAYAVTVTHMGSNNEAITATVMTQTTTQFVLTHRSNDNTTSTAATNDFHYIAIGLAP